MKPIILCLLLCGAFASGAQPFRVITITKNNGDYKFPLFESSKNKELARKITGMVLTSLGSDPAYKNPYDSVRGEDEYSFEMGANNARVLSFITSGSHNGAGHHETTTYYNLDAPTGVQLDISQLMSADGQKKMSKALYKLWVAAVKANAAGGNQPEAYQDCLKEAAARTEVAIDHILITDSGIRVWTEICLDGSQYSYDTVKGPYDFSLGQLLPMLTPFGYSLFTNIPPVGPTARLLRGLVDNKYPISLTLFQGASLGELTGMIVYDRIGQPITLKGTIDGNNVTLHEVDASDKPASDIKLTWDGAKLSGTFINLTAKKEMGFVAGEVR